MGIVLAVLAALLLCGVLGYNALVRRRNAVDNAFASVDAYLLMRYDLIPNLVETVKSFAQHESATLAAVARHRAEALAPGLSTDQRVRLDNRIVPEMGRLVAIGEAHPALRASEQFQQLQRGLNEVEERLSAARRAFNAAVLEYNNGVEQFPLNLLAGPLGFRRRAFFEVAQTQRQPVPVAPAARG